MKNQRGLRKRFGERSHSWINEAKQNGREDIIVVAGGVIHAQDYDFLYKAGVLGIFGPGTKISIAAKEILDILLKFYED